VICCKIYSYRSSFIRNPLLPLNSMIARRMYASTSREPWQRSRVLGLFVLAAVCGFHGGSVNIDVAHCGQRREYNREAKYKE
jgi:hypothetical protein